ncbi:PDZ/DHR/GLGF domain protein [Ancylostoma duodenale]|uniref:PDZ/DHR/GLGF domain protein n=1 Tax=Ancylostoma duodenale TaxID=51022 RepID=A0A0C2D0W5_9BILA|nr:PDZ/DHR/GLGF domain protein [Ancylostoma duodenale]
MSKSVSIPIALSELKRCSLKRLSSHRERRDTSLNGFVISVAEVANGVRVYGTAAERAGLTVGDEILAVNDVEIEGKSHEEVVKYIQELHAYVSLLTTVFIAISRRIECQMRE